MQRLKSLGPLQTTKPGEQKPLPLLEFVGAEEKAEDVVVEDVCGKKSMIVEVLLVVVEVDVDVEVSSDDVLLVVVDVDVELSSDEVLVTVISVVGGSIAVMVGNAKSNDDDDVDVNDVEVEVLVLEIGVDDGSMTVMVGSPRSNDEDDVEVKDVEVEVPKIVKETDEEVEESTEDVEISKKKADDVEEAPPSEGNAVTETGAQPSCPSGTPPRKSSVGLLHV